MDYYFLSKYRLTYIYIILPIIVCIVIYVVFAIYYKVEHKTTFYRAFCHTINQSKLMIVILTAIISLILIGGDLMLIAFNDNRWWFTENTRISKKIGDWGDFATCLAAFFALISILLAYKAFISQVNASKRTSFDATFTQIFAQHKVLYDKALQHKIGNSITWVVIYGYIDNINNQKGVFALCRERYINSKKQDIEEFWSDFNTAIGQHVSADFKNYFKYIYHEVSIVMQEESIDNEMKKRYIGIIQSQMNYDELLCYLINQVEYFNYWKNNQEKNREIYKRAETHARNLRDNRFFEELCKSRSVYTDLVRRIIGTDANGRINDNDFIDESWFFHDS